MFTALSSAIPALLVFMVWRILEETIITSLVIKSLPVELQQLSANELSLVLNEMKNVAFGGFATHNTCSHHSGGRRPLCSNHELDEKFGRHHYHPLQSLYPPSLPIEASTKIYGPATWLRVWQNFFFFGCSTVAILTTLGIVLSVLFESLRFFQSIPFFDFLFGLQWSPQTAMRVDQAGSSGAFGAVPVFVGTILIALIAMSVAIPVGLLSAIYLSEYASPRMRTWAKPMLEILAGIPTVVYGFFAALTVAPLIRDIGQAIGPAGFLGKRTCGRAGYGHHDHPLCLFAFRRCYPCGAPGYA